MVQAEGIDVYRLSEKERPADGERVHKEYSDTICLTKAPEFNNPTRYYRSTYDFSSPKRFKTVVRLEPTLAPIRYYRAINYGIPREFRHKSTVDCDFRPRPKSFSETTWIFPKQGRDIYVSTLERNQIVDTTWYRSKVSTTGTSSEEQKVNGHVSSAEYESSDEEIFEKTTPQNGFASSSEDERLAYITNNNCKKGKHKSNNDSFGASTSSDED